MKAPQGQAHNGAPGLRTAIEAHLGGLEAQLSRLRHPGVEAVHDARVAARRFRALLRGVESALNPVLMQQLEFELRAIGRTLAPLRDADVRRTLLAKALRALLRGDAELRTRDGAAVAAFIAGLDAERLRERHELRAIVKSPAWRARLERLRTLVQDDALSLPSRDSLATALDPEIERRWRRLRRDAQADLDDPRRLHRLRIHAKVVRYLLEDRAGSAGQPGLPAADLVRRLQNALGELHDRVLQRAWLQNTALPPAVLAAWVDCARVEEVALRRRVRKLVRELKQSPPAVTATGTG